MSERAKIFLLAVSFCLVVIRLTASLMSEDWIGAVLWSLLFAGPMAFSVAIRRRSAWFPFLVGVTAIWSTIPIAFVDRFAPVILFGVGLAVVLIVGAATGRGVPSVWRGQGVLFATVFLVIIGRTLVDRPGSARIGESGGLGEAVILCSTAVCFWASAVSVQWVNDWKKAWRVLLAVGTIGWIIETAALFLDPRREVDLVGPSYFLFLVPVWLLSGLLVAWWVERRSALESVGTRGVAEGSWWGDLPVLAIPIVLSATAPHRSRPLFALGIVLVICWLYRRFLRGLFTLVPVLSLVLVAIVWKGTGLLPESTQRSLSIFSTTVASGLPKGVEIGWQSEFRGAMYRLSWEQIKRRPLTGVGFDFKTQDIESLAPWTGIDANKRNLEGLALTIGGYHNSLVELTVVCGIPTAALLILGLGTVLLRYVVLVRSLPFGPEKRFYAALAGYSVAITGQMLMNGGGLQLVVICTIVGGMHGILYAHQFKLQRTENSGTAGKNVLAKQPEHT